MMNAVDKYSTDNIADNEMIIAVDDVVKKDYDSAVVRIKKALARLRDLKAMVYSNISSSYSKMGRDKEEQRYLTMPETNMTVPQKNLKNVIKAGSCLTI